MSIQITPYNPPEPSPSRGVNGSRINGDRLEEEAREHLQAPILESIAPESRMSQPGIEEQVGPPPTHEESEGEGLPEVVDAAQWCENPPPLMPTIIDGLLRAGAKLILGGCSKSRKSWTLIQLALCLANGLRFLGLETRKSNVLYINLELPEAEMCQRVIEVSDAMDCSRAGLKIWNLRGHARPLESLVGSIIFQAHKEGAGVVILDPIYKVLGDRCENSNEDVAGLLNYTDEIVERTGASFIFAHHFAKGSQGGKFVEDRISGAGAWWRDPDAGIFMTPLEDEGGFNITCMARSFPPLEEFAARAVHPLMVEDEGLDPANLRQPGPSKKVTSQQLLEQLPPEGTTYSKWRDSAMAKFSISEATFNRRLKEAERKNELRKEGDLYFQVTS